MTRRLWPAILLTGLGISILCGLGVWQLQRLAWKEALIAAVTDRMARPSVGLAEAAGSTGDAEIEDFTKLRADGRLVPARSLFLISTFEGGAGWTVVTPIVTTEGFTVLVDRGNIPDGARGAILAEPERSVEVTGIVRHRRNSRGSFDPENDPAGNVWYWWDVQAMAKAAGGGGRALPFILQQLPSDGDENLPRPSPPEAGFRNNHLQYAMTWFGLAAALAVVGFLAIRRDRNSLLDGPPSGR